MRNLIKEYFYYNRRERNGIFILAFICLLGALFPKLYQQFSSPNSSTNFSKFESDIQRFENQFKNNKTKETEAILFHFDPNTVVKEDLESLGLSTKFIQTFLNFRSKGARFFKKEDFKKVYGLKEEDYLKLEPFIVIENGQESQKDFPKYNEKQKAVFEAELFEFDPNTVLKNDLLRLGFSERAANNLLKFRDRGGTIRTKDELSKIYGVDDVLFERLYSFIKIQETVSKEKKLVNEKQYEIPKEKTTVSIIVDINTASAEDFQQLKGIGPYYSKKIIKFREALGGFHAIEQIAETYNFPDSTYQKIRPYLKIEAAPRQINLNSISVEELAMHPYLKFNQAKVIVNYRSQHGPFTNLQELEKIVILSPEIINKIKPYLKIE